jgi:hypothetical protein
MTPQMEKQAIIAGMIDDAIKARNTNTNSLVNKSSDNLELGGTKKKDVPSSTKKAPYIEFSITGKVGAGVSTDILGIDVVSLDLGTINKTYSSINGTSDDYMSLGIAGFEWNAPIVPGVPAIEHLELVNGPVGPASLSTSSVSFGIGIQVVIGFDARVTIHY